MALVSIQQRAHLASCRSSTACSIKSTMPRYFATTRRCQQTSPVLGSFREGGWSDEARESEAKTLSKGIAPKCQEVKL